MANHGGQELRRRLAEVLREVANAGDPTRRHQFFWQSPEYRFLGPSILAGSIGLEWYLTGSGGAMAKLLAHLYNEYPNLRERATFDEASSEVLRILSAHALDCFDETFFTQHSPQTLFDALKSDAALDSLCEALAAWASPAVRTCAIVRLADWMPESDIITAVTFWVRPRSTPPSVLTTAFPIMERERFRFDCFPPDRAQTLAPDCDSLMGVIVDGEQQARARICALAGALCLALEPHQPWHITGGEIDRRLVLIHGTTMQYGTWDMPIPHVGPARRVSGASLSTMAALVQAQENDDERGRRLQRALGSIGTGWRKSSKETFLSHYTALEIWFGGRQKNVIDGVRDRRRDDGGEKIARLTGLRDDLTHGRGETVERAQSYLDYRESFKTDPSRDLFGIARRVLTQAAR